MYKIEVNTFKIIRKMCKKNLVKIPLPRSLGNKTSFIFIFSNIDFFITKQSLAMRLSPSKQYIKFRCSLLNLISFINLGILSVH